MCLTKVSLQKGVAVMLESISHNVAAGGRTNTVGEFVLTTYRPNDGTPIEVAMMPAEYADFAASGLTVTVSEKGKKRDHV